MKNFYRDGGLVISVCALVGSLVTLAFIIYNSSPQIFWMIAPFIVLSSGFALGKLISVTRKSFHYFTFAAEQIDRADRVSLYSLPLAAAVVDSEMKFIWFNQCFISEFPAAAAYGNPLSLITDAPAEKLMKTGGASVKYKNKHYRANMTVPHENVKLYMVYFTDITEQTVLEINKKISQPVVLTIMIDNYDEMFEGTPESEKARVTVKIDKLLEDFTSSTTGIMKKFNRDRIWVVIEQQHVDRMIEEKVRLLDKAREIAVTDRVNVSFSIGIGTTAKNLAESEIFARQALDMALGRGGDQAAVKTASGFEFYGGVSRGIERRTKVKTRIIANSLIDLVQESDSVYIMGHKFSDLDSIGASVGLACGIKNLGKNAFVVIDRPASLGTELIDRIKSGTDEKNPLFLHPPKARDMFRDSSLLIIVDTHNPKLLEDTELYQQAERIVVIDHHRKMVNHIDNALIFHHEAYASSACEMVAELLQYFGTAGKITALQAEALLAGIMLDTKNFTIKTGVRTFEAAAFLRKLGADTVNVKGLFTNSFENYKFKVNLIATAEIYKKCAIASSDGVSDSMRLAAPQVADEMLTISNVDASFVIYRTSQSEVYISARSFGAVNVQLIMEALGGGGHQTMAGTQLRDASVSEAKNRLIEKINLYYESLNGE